MILFVDKFVEDFKSKAIKIDVIGTPPSTQHIYGRRKGGGSYLKKEAISYRRDVMYEAKQVHKLGNPPSVNNFVVGILYYFPDKKIRDVDNYRKLIFDGMSGVVWEDDKQIELDFSRKYIDRDNPRVEIYYIEC